jgi:hypothetical protein
MANKKTTKKAPAKNVKAAKKTAVPQTNLKTASLPPEFFADLTEVFKRHGWAALPSQLSFSSASGCDRVCDDGSIAQPISIRCPDGTTKIVCACPGEDPTCDDATT